MEDKSNQLHFYCSQAFAITFTSKCRAPTYCQLLVCLSFWPTADVTEFDVPAHRVADMWSQTCLHEAVCLTTTVPQITHCAFSEPEHVLFGFSSTRIWCFNVQTQVNMYTCNVSTGVSYLSHHALQKSLHQLYHTLPTNNNISKLQKLNKKPLQSKSFSIFRKAGNHKSLCWF